VEEAEVMDTNELPQRLQGDPDGVVRLGERYVLGEIIGRGAMATVYRAHDEVLGRDVAIKLFLSGPDDDELSLRQQTEIQVLSVFDHPGLVRLYDAGLDARDTQYPHTYLVMELVDGPDLREWVSAGPTSAAETAMLGAAVADALAHVHENGIIHRDIKPANIIIPGGNAASGPKLADFGIARLIEGSRLTATGATVGTATYLSPEQATGSPLTPASDIYSLGLVLIECLKGEPEYPGTPVESAVARLHRPPEIPSWISAEFADLLTAMTDVNPAQRPSAKYVAGVLSALAESEASAPSASVATAPLPITQGAPPADSQWVPRQLPPPEQPAFRTRERQLRRRTASRRGKVAAVLGAGTVAAAFWATGAMQGGAGDSGNRPADVSSTAPGNGSPTPAVVPVPAPTPTVDTPSPAPTLAVPVPLPTEPAPAPPPAVNPGGGGKGGNDVAEKNRGKGKDG
jgi:serine/threonine protein kinase